VSYPERAPARRPGAVVSAAVILVLMALGALAYAVAGLAILDGTVERFRASAGGTGATAADVDTAVSLLRVSVILSAVVTVLVGLVLVALALGLRAGRPGARVGAWVVCGLGLLCGCCALAVLVGERTAPLRLGADERVTADLLARLADAYPSGWIPVNAALSVGQLLGYAVVAALLTLPAAGAWFRRSAPGGPVAPSSAPTPPYRPAGPPPAGWAAPGPGGWAAPGPPPGGWAGPSPYAPPPSPYGPPPPASAPPASAPPASAPPAAESPASEVPASESPAPPGSGAAGSTPPPEDRP
jgi:hypothetical protein